MNSFFRSPISVKLLFIIYAYSVYKYGSLLIRPDVMNKLGIWATLVPFGLAIVFIVLIFFKVWWCWIAGICESLYFAVISAYTLSKGDQIIATATDSAMKTKNLQKLTPEQVKMGMNIGFYGVVGLVIAGGIITAFLWYKSRLYFQPNPKPK